MARKGEGPGTAEPGYSLVLEYSHPCSPLNPEPVEGSGRGYRRQTTTAMRRLTLHLPTIIPEAPSIPSRAADARWGYGKRRRAGRHGRGRHRSSALPRFGRSAHTRTRQRTMNHCQRCRLRRHGRMAAGPFHGHPGHRREGPAHRRQHGGGGEAGGAAGVGRGLRGNRPDGVLTIIKCHFRIVICHTFPGFWARNWCGRPGASRLSF